MRGCQWQKPPRVLSCQRRRSSESTDGRHHQWRVMAYGGMTNSDVFYRNRDVWRQRACVAQRRVAAARREAAWLSWRNQRATGSGNIGGR